MRCTVYDLWSNLVCRCCMDATLCNVVWASNQKLNEQSVCSRFAWRYSLSQLSIRTLEYLVFILNDSLIIFGDHNISWRHYLLAKWVFDTSEENHLSFFQNGYFFKKFISQIVSNNSNFRTKISKYNFVPFFAQASCIWNINAM